MKANEIKEQLSLLNESVTLDCQKIAIEYTHKLINKYEKEILMLRKDLFTLLEKNMNAVTLLGGANSMGEVISMAISKDRYLAGYDIFNGEVGESHGKKQAASQG